MKLCFDHFCKSAISSHEKQTICQQTKSDVIKVNKSHGFVLFIRILPIDTMSSTNSKGYHNKVNVTCLQFVDFLNKYTYLSVKNNWNRNMANIQRFLPSHVPSLSPQKFSKPKIRFLRGFIMEKSYIVYPFGNSRDSSRNFSTLSTKYFLCRLQCKKGVEGCQSVLF